MAQANKPFLLVIAGPTAVGKTAVAVEVARHFGTEILSADSRQCYREMNIGVARPSPVELAAVPHHFIASHSIAEDVTAATFESFGLDVLEQCFRKNKVAVVTGGTGLYIKALTSGIDSIPAIPAEVRQWVLSGYATGGLPWLQQEIEGKDPLFFAKGEVANPQRLMRALEVVASTGRSILSYHSTNEKERPFRTIEIALGLPRPQLYERINERVVQMMEKGLLQEVEGLLPYQHWKALQTVGYKELFAYYKGDLSLDEAVALVQQNTRRYAKRQITWFTHQGNYQWLPPDADAVLKFVREKMAELKESL